MTKTVKDEDGFIGLLEREAEKYIDMINLCTDIGEFTFYTKMIGEIVKELYELEDFDTYDRVNALAFRSVCDFFSEER